MAHVRPCWFITLKCLLLPVIITLYIGSAPGQSADTVDLFMAESPRVLTIYNKYQQEISFEESRLFQPYVPMEIVQYDALMSDGFTHSMIVRLRNMTFYLIKADEKNLAQIDAAGFTAYLTRCSMVSDTVRILQDEAVTLSKRMPSTHLPDTPTADMLLRRLYLKDGHYYAEGLGRPEVYGWTRFSSKTRGRSWAVFERSKASVSELLSPALRTAIETHLQSVNTVLSDLFRTMNQQTGQTRAAPQWQMVVEEDRIICRLNEPSYADQFVESTQYLVNDLDAFVRRDGLSVEYVNRYIIISRKP